MRGLLVNILQTSKDVEDLIIEEYETGDIHSIAVEKGVCDHSYIGKNISIHTTIVSIANSDQKSKYHEDLVKFRKGS